MEFAFGKVPFHLKTTHTDNEILLKRLIERVLPPEFDRQRKQSLSITLV
jgi:asparagine synthase (glutamine-hydrolysing)